MKKFLTMLLALVLFQGTALAQDYLDEDLRAAVEQLKNDVAEAPTNADTMRNRVAIFWDWVNAYSMTGRHLPVNVTATITAFARLEAGERPTRGLLKGLDDFIYEFTVLDDRPDALGTVTIANSGPFAAESWQSIKVIYTVGEMGMVEGGTVLIARLFLSDAGAWQVTDPSVDNYISIRTSNSDAQFVATSVPVRGMHGGFRGAAPQPAYRLEGTSLSKGDTVTLIYGDTSGGGRGLKMQSFSNDASSLPIYVNLEDNDIFFSLPIPTFAVSGKEVHAIHGFAPSVVATNEPFEVSVRAEDVYYNRASGAIPELQVMLNGMPASIYIIAKV